MSRGAGCPDAPPTKADQPQTRCTASGITPIKPVGVLALVGSILEYKRATSCMIAARQGLQSLSKSRMLGAADKRWFDRAEADLASSGHGLSDQILTCASSVFDRAVSSCTSIISSNGGDPFLVSKAYKLRGDAYFSARQYASAVSDYSEAIKIRPQNVGAFNGRGRSYDYLGRFDSAVSDFNEALRTRSSISCILL